MKHTTIFILVLTACGGEDMPSTTTSVGVTSDTLGGTGESTGDTGSSPEQALCEKSDECNLLKAGVNIQDCTDWELMCTDMLITSQYTDWSAQAEECLDLANCTNFAECAQVLSPCPPIGPGTCSEICDYCYLGTELENMCPNEYNGSGDGCDCGCQFSDIDCA